MKTLIAIILIMSMQRPQDLLNRAVDDFQNGRIDASVAGFDNLVRLSPAIAPQLWQRGIALYYAGRYKDCREQFESHRTVNPNDVENPIWHFLCVARLESPAKAREALLPVGPDPRVPMMQVYEMFQGKRTPDEVLAVAGSSIAGQFYGQLCVALYFEATGNEQLAKEHMKLAASPRFAEAGGYMHGVARVHVKVRGW